MLRRGLLGADHRDRPARDAVGGNARAEPMRIAYLSPSFDISDAWERVFWAIQGRLDELGVEYDVQALAVASHVDHAGQLAQVEAVIARGVDYVFLGPTEYEAAIPALRKLKQAERADRRLQLPRAARGRGRPGR